MSGRKPNIPIFIVYGLLPYDSVNRQVPRVRFYLLNRKSSPPANVHIQFYMVLRLIIAVLSNHVNYSPGFLSSVIHAIIQLFIKLTF